MGATVDMHQIYDAHIHQKDGAPVEVIPFALKKAPDPNRLLRLLVTHVMLLRRNGVLGSTGPVH